MRKHRPFIDSILLATLFLAGLIGLPGTCHAQVTKLPMRFLYLGPNGGGIFHETVREVCEAHAVAWSQTAGCPAFICASIEPLSWYSFGGAQYTLSPLGSGCMGATFTPPRQYYCDGQPTGTYTYNPPSDGCSIPLLPDKPPVCIGNPIDPSVGAKLQQEVDYMGTGAFPLELTRRYNSRSVVPSSTPLPPLTNDTLVRVGNIYTSAHSLYVGVSAVPAPGYSVWRFNYQRAIVKSADNMTQPAMIVHRENSSVRFFVQTNGNWMTIANRTNALVSLTDPQNNLLGWRHSDPESGETEIFDTTGKLIAIIRTNGLAHTLQYDPSSGRLVSVVDSFGRSLQMSHDGQGRLSTFTDPNGETYSYGYDAAENLVARRRQ